MPTTVAELVSQLQAMPQDLYVAVYSSADEGGYFVDGVTVQYRNDRKSRLYYAGDSPLDLWDKPAAIVTITG